MENIFRQSRNFTNERNKFIEFHNIPNNQLIAEYAERDFLHPLKLICQSFVGLFRMNYAKKRRQESLVGRASRRRKISGSAKEETRVMTIMGLRPMQR